MSTHTGIHRGYYGATMRWFLQVTSIICVLCTLSRAVEQPCKDGHLDVAIVGAGPSGSYSAYNLRHTHKKIGLYEYSNRVGGRAYNYFLPNAPDVVLQLGAMRFVKGKMPILEKVIKELKLETTIFTEGFGRMGRTRYVLRGKSYTKYEVLYGDVPYQLSPEEKDHQANLMEYYLSKLTPQYKIGSPITRNDFMNFRVPKANNRYLYQLTFGEAINLVATRGGDQFIKAITHHNSYIQGRASAVLQFHDSLGEDFNTTGTDIYTLVKGMNAIAEELVIKFIYSSPDHFFTRNMKLQSIKSIQTGANKEYELEFQPTITNEIEGTTTVDTSAPALKICASQVILAMPVYALRRVNWQPIHNPPASLRYSTLMTNPVCKVFMTFDTRWWLDFYNDTYEVYGDKRFLPNAMYDWKNSNISGNYILLASYADARKGQKLLDYQKTGKPITGSALGAHRVTRKMYRQLLRDLSRAVNVSRSKISDPKTSMVQFWTRYPFGSGWVVIEARYDFNESMEVMRQPSVNDEVYVVGSDYGWGAMIGWQEGGLETVDTVISKFF